MIIEAIKNIERPQYKPDDIVSLKLGLDDIIRETLKDVGITPRIMLTIVEVQPEGYISPNQDIYESIVGDIPERAIVRLGTENYLIPTEYIMHAKPKESSTSQS